MPDEFVGCFSEGEGLFSFGPVMHFVRAEACKHLDNVLLPV